MKIAIVGYGVEGESNYRYWSQIADDITIVDENLNPSKILPSGVKTILGPGSLDNLYGYDLVVRTAGMPARNIKTNAKIWSSTNEFFAKCPAKIIGVTGTKGKGTTSSLIASIMEETGKKVWLVGNIGIPPLGKLADIAPEDIVVFELSSFQLWDLEISPTIAVVLPIEPEHLDVHKDFYEYLEAKGSITRSQKSGDICIYYPKDSNSRLVSEQSDMTRRIGYSVEGEGGAYIESGNFNINEQFICSTNKLHLIGTHNLENACASITAAYYAGASLEEIARGIESFRGLPHRLEYVKEVNGVEYYNDTCATAPAATAAAIMSFDRPEIVIIGGKHKGGPLESLISAINEKKSLIKEILLIGDSKDFFYQQLKQSNPEINPKLLDYRTMPEIVNYASSVATSGDVVLLSPACASFDMFKDYYDRGDQFKDSVNKL
jgi:UDP-N-acetylmuramoylalanine--D-glutamate ligase